MKLLTVDVETYPGESYTWGIRKQFVAVNQIKKPGGLLCFAAKFRDSREMVFRSLWQDGHKAMTRALHKLFDEADVVMGWNSDKFDVRWIQAQFLAAGMPKPSPITKVDLIKSVRRQVALPSYQLAYVSRWLGVGSKVDTGGFELWTRVMAGDPAARALMKKYNINDVRITEAVYDKLAASGWVLGLPNASIDGGDVCPNCGGDHFQRRGYALSKTLKYARLQCRDCGTWLQSVHAEPNHARLKVCA